MFAGSPKQRDTRVLHGNIVGWHVVIRTQTEMGDEEFSLGQIALQVTLDALNGKFTGGFVETPTTIVDKDNITPVLQDEASLYPKPSKKY